MAYEDKEGTKSSTGEDDLLEQFKADLGESRAFMEPIQQRMDRDYEAYRNYRDKAEDSDLFKVSDFFEYIETVVPIVTNNRIRASVHSDYPDYITHAKGLNDILDNTYDVNNWDYVSQELFRQALINRFGLVYTGYDKKYKNGTGKLCIDACNSRWAFLDPNPTQFEDSRYFFYATPMRKTQVFKMYPGKKSAIEASIQRNMPTNDTRGGGKPGSWFKTWIGTIKNYLSFNQAATQAKPVSDPFSSQEMQEQAKHKNVIAFIEYWYRDDNDDWRKSCWADDVLLTDEKNPFWHGGLPYDILSPVKDPMSCMGIPLSEQTDAITKQRNAMMNYVLANAKLHANPPMLYNTAYGNIRDPLKLREQADEGVIPVSNPDFVPMNSLADYMNVPQLPGHVVNMFEQLGVIKDAATGVNDSFRGTQQASSGKEVQLQQEAAYTRIKTMIDQVELMNKKVGEKTIVNAMQFYNQQRAFRIKGDYTKYDNVQMMAEQQGQPMPFDIEKVQKGINPETQEPAYDRTEFFLYANPNEWTKLDQEGTFANEGEEGAESADNGEEKQEKEVEKAYKILQMTVEIEAGSSLPQSRLARREEANELFTAGAIDQESLLDTYDWPNRDEIIKRMNEKAQQQAQMQAQAAQAEAQAKLQAEQQKMQMQMEMKQMELQAQAQQTQANNAAKMEQQQAKNKGEVAQQGMENSGAGLAETIDQIRQQVPEAEQLSDEELLQALGVG